MAAARPNRRRKPRRRADMPLLGGIRPPIAVLSALLLSLAVVAALILGRVDDDGPAEAVLDSQQYFAEDGAVALRASLDESVTDLNRTASLFNAGEPVPADAVLDKVGRVYQKWRGTAVIEIASGDLLAARGENLPLTAIDLGGLGEEGGLAPRMVRLDNGETRLLTFALLTWPGRPQQLLVASSSLKFPGVSLGKFRAIAVVDTDGRILSDEGIPEPEQVLTDGQRRDVDRDTRQLRTFAERAAKKTDEHPLTTKEPGAGGFPGVSGSLTGDTHAGDVAVAGYAGLAGPRPGEGTVATGLGLTVVAMVRVAVDPAAETDTVAGLAAAGALLVVGALVVALLLRRLQAPLLRLFLESRRLTRGELRRPVRVPRSGEAARIGAALERLRRQLLGPPQQTAPDSAAADDRALAPPRGLRRIGARGLLVVAAVLLLTWSAPLLLLLNRAGDDVVVPQQLVSDQRERTDTLTDRVRRSLNEAHADLDSVASVFTPETARDHMTAVLDQTLQRHQRYRALYVLGPDGDVLAHAGEDPARPADAERPPRDTPVAVSGQGGKEPVIAAYAEVPGSEDTAVVGELRIDFLNSLLKRPGLGEVRVVDAERRVIGADGGYRAFEELPDERLDSLVTASNVRVGLTPRPGSTLYRDGDDVRIAAAAPFVGGGAAKPLGWTVVSWQPASGLEIPEYSLQHRTVLVGLLGVTAAVACLGWLHIVVVRPLRALADAAEALAGGDRRTVLYPRHHDEVGAVTRSLELLRQRLQEQPRRPAAARARPRAAHHAAGRT